MKVDFSGYVTKNDVKCSDGRTIRHGAFKDDDGKCVPLVWQHLHNDPGNVIGKIYLEHRDDGVYGYGVLNETQKGKDSRELLRHGDLDSMSIYANGLIEKAGNVMHGCIKEVSLVLSGANPGAKIEHVTLTHSDGFSEDLDDEVVIHELGTIDNWGAEDLHIDLYHADGSLVEDPNDPVLTHADDEDKKEDSKGGKTVEEVFNEMTEEQQQVVYALIGAAVADAEEKNSSKEESKSDDKSETKHSDIYEGGNEMKTNPFETQGTRTGGALTHADIVANGTYKAIAEATFAEVTQRNVKFRDALKHASQEYGIENIEILFPDAKALSNSPEFVKRRMEWVSVVMGSTRHTPFSRIKSVFADITAEEARAKGYIKGNQKIEEVFPVMSRTTTPQTVYKKQKLDRDDILDITDFDVVAWLRAEMRIMLEEEIARAILIGDGRLVTSPDKIKEDHIRPIWTDDPFYSLKMAIPAEKADDFNYLADTFVRARKSYEGSGTPVAFMAPETVTDLMLVRDNNNVRMYKTEDELKDALRVSQIVEVPLFYNQVRTDATSGKKYKLNAIVVNLKDYTVGADKGGEITTFDDFDIDYNQEKYLIETRISGALTGYHSAIVIETEDTTNARMASKSST